MSLYHLELTSEEIKVFLTIMGVKTINGLEEYPFFDYDDQEISKLLHRGEQSLINRGLLKIGEDEVILDDALVALVGSSATPEATFALTRTEPNGSSQTYYFNATQEILVEQTLPESDSFTFTYIPNAEALRYRLEALLAPLRSLSGYDLEEPPAIFSLSAESMASFLERCRNDDHEAARKTLILAGWPEATANRLVHDCATNPSWVGLTAWNLRFGDIEALDPVMIFQGDDDCWLVESVKDEPGMLQLRLVPGVVCEEQLMMLLEPLLTAYRSD